MEKKRCWKWSRILNVSFSNETRFFFGGGGRGVDNRGMNMIYDLWRWKMDRGVPILSVKKVTVRTTETWWCRSEMEERRRRRRWFTPVYVQIWGAWKKNRGGGGSDGGEGREDQSDDNKNTEGRRRRRKGRWTMFHIKYIPTEWNDKRRSSCGRMNRWNLNNQVQSQAGNY